ncbi:MAG: OmpH family outer membrane protein [Myxococcales bacterium]|nr:OmpH family outer membrane protein [Myxococcales bacterium]MCB9705836.1 OmpH family outer membrane protein [Myxococcales bacterium]
MHKSTPRRHALALAAAAGLLVAGISAAPTATPAHAAIKKVRGIAMVDMQRVLMETKQGKAAREKLESSSKAKQKKLDKKRSKLEADQAKLKNLAGDQLMAAQEQLQKDFMEMQNIYMTMQQELAEQEGQILEDMYKKCQGLIDKMASEMEVDLVLVRDATTVLYTDDALDITNDLIKRYDEKYPKGGDAKKGK